MIVVLRIAYRERGTKHPVWSRYNCSMMPESQVDDDRLWTPGLRLFLSHLSEHKVYVAGVQEHLRQRGVSSFVAHEDIEPATEWVDEIEYALKTADAMAVFLHEGCHESHWADQEVGAAVGRGIPVIPIRFEVDPYGFIGRYQALQGMADEARMAGDILKILHKHDGFSEKIGDGLIAAAEHAGNFDEANVLAGRIRNQAEWTSEQVKALVRAGASNTQVLDAYKCRPAIENIAGEILGYRISLKQIAPFGWPPPTIYFGVRVDNAFAACDFTASDMMLMFTLPAWSSGSRYVAFAVPATIDDSFRVDDENFSGRGPYSFVKQANAFALGGEPHSFWIGGPFPDELSGQRLRLSYP